MKLLSRFVLGMSAVAVLALTGCQQSTGPAEISLLMPGPGAGGSLNVEAVEGAEKSGSLSFSVGEEQSLVKAQIKVVKAGNPALVAVSLESGDEGSEVPGFSSEFEIKLGGHTGLTVFQEQLIELSYQKK